MLVGGTELELRFQSIESWLRELGPAGLIVFARLYATVTSVLLPDSLFRVAAGALFGYVDGLTGVVLGTLLASLLQFAIAQIFTTRIQHVIATRPWQKPTVNNCQKLRENNTHTSLCYWTGL